MRQMALRKFAIAISTVAFAALFSVGWSEQRGISLSVESAQARTRLYVHPYYYNPYRCRQECGGNWRSAGSENLNIACQAARSIG